MGRAQHGLGLHHGRLPGAAPAAHPRERGRPHRGDGPVRAGAARSRYTWGGAGPYELGFDCSGLVLQAIYAAGRDPQPINVVKHAEPTYRTSRELYAHPGLLSVPVAQRRRGDLIFYTNSAGTVHHVTIDLGDGTMMEAYGRHAAIRKVVPQYGISYIAPYVKRAFA
ncbi:MAG TPA: C40 family peptidase [Propionibacterium sp.]|nr:C40 family peptidase [Propionibacterium sp.]